MENYSLKSNETVLYKGIVTDIISDKKKIKKECLLTNLNLVFINKSKKLFREEVEVEIYDVKNVKIYDSTYQIIRKKEKVEIYLLNAEKFLEFANAKNAKEFSEIALRLVSGNSKLVRGVKKIKKAVAETNEALEIDIAEAAKKTAVFAGNVAIEVATGAGASKKTQVMGKIAQAILHPKSKTNEYKLASEQQALIENKQPKE